MSLFVCLTSFMLALLLSSRVTSANITSEITDMNTEPLLSHTEITDTSSERNAATTQQHQSVLLSVMMSTVESSSSTTSINVAMNGTLADSFTAPSIPEALSLDEIDTESSVTRSLTRDAAFRRDSSTTAYTSSTTLANSDVSTESLKHSDESTKSLKHSDVSTKSLKHSAIAPGTTEVGAMKPLESSEVMPKTTVAPVRYSEGVPETTHSPVKLSNYLRVKSLKIPSSVTEDRTTPQTKATTLKPLESSEAIPKITVASVKSFATVPETTHTSVKLPKSFERQPETTTAFAKEDTTPKFPSTSPNRVLEDIFPPSTPSIFFENLTSSEETVEHNNVLMNTESETATTNKGVEIVVGHKCYKIFQDSILWNDTDGGMLALKSCPAGYQGSMYRPCFSSGKWGNVDYSECRLEHLGRMRHMIVHQVEKGMLGNMYVLAEEFSKYISSVDMKSPMDRLEAFEILNTFLKVDMNLKMDKSRDTKYIQTLLHSCNELIKKKTVLFSPGSQENKLISEKAVEMVFDLTYFAERSLRGLLKTQKKQIAFRSSPNVVLYLYRGKLSGQFTLTNFTSEYERDDDSSSIFSLENTLERSAYALIWIKGLRRLLSTKDLVVNSDVAVATILSPLNSLNRMAHPPTFDIGLRMEKAEVQGYTLKCGQLWNMSKLWNTKDCTKANVKGDIVTCRCHHLGSIALLLEEDSQSEVLPSISPIGKLISCSCVISLSATVLTLVTYYFLLHREEQHLSIFIFVNMITCLLAVQLMMLYGVNKGGQNEVCMSFAIMLHYLFMVLCCWVVAYGVNLLKRLRTNMEYNGRPRDFCAACWISPGIMLTVAFILNPEGYETQLYCWMNIERGILWSFVFPVTALILINTVVMILALKTFNEQMSVTHRIEICKTRNSLRAGITLLPFFAVNWFFGILAVEDSYNLLLQAIFSCTNAMQGILTFIFFCLMDANIVAFFRMKITVVTRRPKVSSMKLTKSGSFPILERSLISLPDRRPDCTPLLAGRSPYHDAPAHDDPCCSNIRV